MLFPVLKQHCCKFTLQLDNALIKKITLFIREERHNVTIIDVSVFNRNRSNTLELLAKIFNHANHKYMCGF